MLWLGSAEVLLCVLLMSLSCAHFAMSSHMCEREDWRGNMEKVPCYHNTIGEGLWCSLMPLIAGICGIVGSRNNANRTKVCLLLIFSILGAVMMVPLIVITSFGQQRSDWRPKSTSYVRVYVAMTAFGSLNLLLCIFSATLSCTTTNCCQQGSTVYVTYASPERAGESGQNGERPNTESVVINNGAAVAMANMTPATIEPLQDETPASQADSADNSDPSAHYKRFENDECYTDQAQLVGS